MNAPAQLAQKKICCSITSEAEINKETILESVGLDIHLLSTNLAPDPEVVLAPNHVKRI